MSAARSRDSVELPDDDVFALVGWLDAQGASNDLVEWVKGRSLGWLGTWTACPRGDWLLALAVRAQVPATDLRRATAEVLALVEEDSSAPGLSDAVAYLRGAAPGGEVTQQFIADADAKADQAGDLAESLAWRAVSLTARSFTDAELAALVPSQVAELAMASVLDCAMMSALGATQARTADVIRRSMALPVLRRA
jgi:hypothetical protein